MNLIYKKNLLSFKVGNESRI